ncbi:MAG: sensor histidine kinase [Streptosporangiaceae bacterium]
MRLRRAKLRTRVLLGVLAVTLVALAAFDIAAVTALRGYLIGRSDQQLRNVLSLYRVNVLPRRHPVGSAGTQPVSAQQRTRPPYTVTLNRNRKVITGPTAILPGALGQFEVVTVSGRRPVMSIMGGRNLVPQIPPDLAALAKSQQGVTVPSRAGAGQLRLMAEFFPGIGIAYATTSLTELDKTVGQLELILVIGSAAAGLIAAGGVAWVMRRGLRPIEVMAGQADKINAGDLTDRVSPHDPRTEMGRLGAALNGMLARIEDFVAEREASQEATRRFFADASHELRTPLASLRVNAELYEQGALPQRSQVDEAMRRITLEAQRMGGLVDDMLRLARLDQHPGQQCEPVDLSALAAECAQRARTASPEGIWCWDIADDLEVTGDEELLRRAIDNVLGNVAAHTPEGSTARLTVTGGDGHVVVEVSDDGPGVPLDQLSRIFDRFYRAGVPSRRPGSGLGLAIVAAVAAALNEPHGLRITLTLPASTSSTSSSQHQPPPAGVGLAHRAAPAAPGGRKRTRQHPHRWPAVAGLTERLPGRSAHQ